MRRLMTGAALLALTGCSIGADLPVAQKAVEQVHTRLNAGQCAQIRDDAATEFKQVSSVENWSGLCAQLIAGLGKFVSLKQTGWNDEIGTSGHLMRVTYDSVFEKGKATEQFLFRIASGKAMLIGYHINSPVFDAPPAAIPTPAPAAPTPK